VSLALKALIDVLHQLVIINATAETVASSCFFHVYDSDMTSQEHFMSQLIQDRTRDDDAALKTFAGCKRLRCCAVKPQAGYIFSHSLDCGRLSWPKQKHPPMQADTVPSPAFTVFRPVQ
jgi:hypothetical protein